jgi:hypothetical protein
MSSVMMRLSPELIYKRINEGMMVNAHLTRNSTLQLNCGIFINVFELS